MKFILNLFVIILVFKIIKYNKLILVRNCAINLVIIFFK